MIKSLKKLVTLLPALLVIACGQKPVGHVTAVNAGHSCSFEESTRVEAANFLTNSNSFSCGGESGLVSAALTNGAGQDLGVEDGFYVTNAFDGKLGMIIKNNELFILYAKNSDLNTINVIRTDVEFAPDGLGNSIINLYAKGPEGTRFVGLEPIIDRLTPVAGGFQLEGLNKQFNVLNVELSPEALPETITINLVDDVQELMSL